MKVSESKDKELHLLEKEVDEAEKKGTVPSSEEMRRLRDRMLKGDEKARERMIVGNMNLVHWYVSRLALPRDSPEYQDAFQEGCISLMTAVERWDPAKGGSFGTYALFWIRQRTNRHYHQSTRTIRIPIHMGQKASKVRKQIIELRQHLDHEPSLEEISDALKIPVKQLEKIFNIPLSTSLDSELRLDSDSSATLHDKLADAHGKSPQEIAMLKDDGRQAIGILKEFYRDTKSYCDGKNKGEKMLLIFCKRYGIFGHGPSKKTLEEVGIEVGLTRERIRQLCAHLHKRRAKKGLPCGTEESLMELIECVRECMDMSSNTDPALMREVLWILGENPKKLEKSSFESRED